MKYPQVTVVNKFEFWWDNAQPAVRHESESFLPYPPTPQYAQVMYLAISSPCSSLRSLRVSQCDKAEERTWGCTLLPSLDQSVQGIYRLNFKVGVPVLDIQFHELHPPATGFPPLLWVGPCHTFSKKQTAACRTLFQYYLSLYSQASYQPTIKIQIAKAFS